MKGIPKPLYTEHALYYEKYLNAVPEDLHVLQEMKKQMTDLANVVLTLTEEQLIYRYEANKWSIKDILLHLVDCERIFLYRALRFARNDKMALPFFDENEFAKEAQADKLPIKQILKEYKTQRLASLAFFNNQTAKTLKRTGTASQAPMSVRACAWINYTHQEHHWKVIQDKYLHTKLG